MIFELIFVYLLGFMLSYMLLITFHNQIGLPDYDLKLDDWLSNDEAHRFWSFRWPIFWLIFVISIFYKLIIDIVMFFYDNKNKNGENTK